MPGSRRHGEVLVDCLFGSGLTRPLIRRASAALLLRLAASACQAGRDRPAERHRQRSAGSRSIAACPTYDLTIALGAWKFAHFLMPACATMGALRLVAIGVGSGRRGSADDRPAAAVTRRRPMRTNTRAGCSPWSRGRCRGRRCSPALRRREPERAMSSCWPTLPLPGPARSGDRPDSACRSADRPAHHGACWSAPASGGMAMLASGWRWRCPSRSRRCSMPMRWCCWRRASSPSAARR